MLTKPIKNRVITVNKQSTVSQFTAHFAC